MSSIRSSKGTGLVVLLALVLLAAGTAGALSIDGSPPDESEAGETTTANVTIEDPFVDQPEQWTLHGETELENATWSVEVHSQQERLDRAESAGSTVEMDISDSSAVRVEVEVTGDTPDVEEWSYDPQEEYDILTLSRLVDGEPQALDGGTWTAHHYTEESKEARNAIEDAEADVEAGDAGTDRLNQSISSYNSGNFENAISLANEAEAAGEESQDDNTLLYVGVGVVLLLAIVGGAILYTRSGDDTGNKLQ